MRDMLGAGVDVMHRNPYLVNKINFPLSAISTIYVSVTMLVQLMLMVALFIIHVACGMQLCCLRHAIRCVSAASSPLLVLIIAAAEKGEDPREIVLEPKVAAL